MYDMSYWCTAQRGYMGHTHPMWAPALSDFGRLAVPLIPHISCSIQLVFRGRACTYQKCLTFGYTKPAPRPSTSAGIERTPEP